MNDQIRADKLRVIMDGGENLGVISREEALDKAEEADLDLVLISPQADPPVAKIIDYSRHAYEKQRAERESRKNQKKTKVQEIQLRPKIAEHDYQTKLNHARRFLGKGALVRVIVVFRGRERAHPALGKNLLDRFFEDLDGEAKLDRPVAQQAKGWAMVLAPEKK